ncbi:DUF1109 domain-containing protein [Pseudacidovorax sp. RU35E]|uniref:DUF1109 domain-containing protein n=1 Tax=Pseudacidovorax sp. RU35E TaxID=1907403 RepID=UPI0009562AE1|nr:DUF1109 domain-containing protein [Pseudacidovorax sp. RU35E]SIQ52884.1 hypothetical protein SAMN05880557_104187 [Pseudacidovorax sp. RU35E]
MKTDDLVNLLAQDAAPVPAGTASRRLWLALACSLPLSLLLMQAGYGVRGDLWRVMALPMLWVKLAVSLCVAVAGLLMVRRLASPGVRPGRAGWLAVVAVGLLWALAVWRWIDMPQPVRMPALMGQTWRTCVVNIGLIGLPVFVAAFWMLRGMAATRPRRAGAAAGLLAGGAGATVYALHCPELTAPFLATWYVLGMLLPVAAGAALGPRLLRW